MDGFINDFWIRREVQGKPGLTCKLDQFSGEAPFRLWASMVVHREFYSRIEAKKPQNLKRPKPRPVESPGPDDVLNVDYLLPIAANYYRIVQGLDPRDRRIWTEVELGWELATTVATRRRVSTCYVSRLLTRVWAQVNKVVTRDERLLRFEAENSRKYPAWVFDRETRPRHVYDRLGYYATQHLSAKLGFPPRTPS
jgi:hypothetical protein